MSSQGMNFLVSRDIVGVSGRDYLGPRWEGAGISEGKGVLKSLLSCALLGFTDCGLVYSVTQSRETRAGSRADWAFRWQGTPACHTLCFLNGNVNLRKTASLFRPVSNQGPFACEAKVITTTLQKRGPRCSLTLCPPKPQVLPALSWSPVFQIE